MPLGRGIAFRPARIRLIRGWISHCHYRWRHWYVWPRIPGGYFDIHPPSTIRDWGGGGGGLGLLFTLASGEIFVQHDPPLFPLLFGGVIKFEWLFAGLRRTSRFRLSSNETSSSRDSIRITIINGHQRIPRTHRELLNHTVINLILLELGCEILGCSRLLKEIRLHWWVGRRISTRGPLSF